MRITWLVLLLATGAWAGAAEDLVEAEQLLREVQDEAAIQVLTRALDRPELTPEQRLEAYLLLGTARHNLRDEEGARLAFTKALETRRDAAAPKLASPKTRALLDEVRAGLEKPTPPSVIAAPPPTPPVAAQQAGWFSARRGIGLGVGVAGLGAAVGGGLLLSRAQATYQVARAEPVAVESDRLYRSAVSANTLGAVVAAAGAAAMLTGLALVVWPAGDAPIALVVSPTSLTLAARF